MRAFLLISDARLSPSSNSQKNSIRNLLGVERPPAWNEASKEFLGLHLLLVQVSRSLI